MPARHTTTNASSASAAEAVFNIIEKLDDLWAEIQKTNCLSTVANHTVEDIFFRERAAGEAAGMYYCGDGERKVLAFAASELLEKTFDLEKLADCLRDMLTDLRRGMMEGGAA